MFQYGSSTRQLSPVQGLQEHSVDNCSDAERVYTSTLTVQRNTSYFGKNAHGVQFQCGILPFHGLTKSLYSTLSQRIQFAGNIGNSFLL